MDHVPHSIYIKPLLARDVWPENPNSPIGSNQNGWRYLEPKEFNTYDSWKIVPTSRPVIAPPKFKENQLELAGTYGSLDFSRAHTGLPIYGNRTGSWEFIVLNDFRPWEKAYSDIQHSVHGRRCLVTLEDDPDYYYSGTLTLNEWRSDPGWSRIVINYNLDPFKYAKNKTSFSLDVTKANTQTIRLDSLTLGREPVNPWIKCTPSSSTGNFKIQATCGNTESALLTRTIMSKRDIYVQYPEILLTNECGNNTIRLDFTGLSDTDSSITSIHVDILYARRYM